METGQGEVPGRAEQGETDGRTTCPIGNLMKGVDNTEKELVKIIGDKTKEELVELLARAVPQRQPSA